MPVQMGVQLYRSQLTPEPLHVLCLEDQGLRGNGDFLARQLWRQGQAYRQLAVYYNEIVHAPLLYLFANVLRLSGDDFESFEVVVDRLKALDQLEQIKATVIVVMKGVKSSTGPTYDLLESLAVQFSLPQLEIIQLFSQSSSYTSRMSKSLPLARHHCSKEFIRRQVAEKRQMRQTHGFMYNATY